MSTLQYISDNKGNKLSVILPIKEYQKLIDELDEWECVKAYDEAKKKPLSFKPLEEVIKKIEKKHSKNKKKN